MKKANKRYIDILAVVSCVSMVFLHTNNCFWDYSKDSYWFSANIIESLLYFSSPVFFMITGVTLIDYRDRYSTKEYFIKRIRKTFIPFVIWSGVSILFRYVTRSSLVKNLTILGIVDGIINNRFWYTYWFFIPLFIIYLLIPLVSLIKKDKRKYVFGCLIMGLFVSLSLIPFIINIFNINIIYPIKHTSVYNYILFALIGYYIDNYELNEFMKKTIYILGLFGLLSHMIGTYVLSREANEIITLLKEYMNVPSVLYSTSVFLFFKETGSRITNEKVLKIVNSLKKYTFAIYLMNYFVIRSLELVFDINITSLLYRLVSPFVVIVICCLITFVVRKIKLNFILPS